MGPDPPFHQQHPFPDTSRWASKRQEQEQGLILEASAGRTLENVECGLQLPYNEFLESVLQYFKLEVQHISPISFVQLSTFEWALCSAGYYTTRAPAHGWRFNQEGGLLGGLHGGLVGERIFQPPEGVTVPVKAYCECRTTG